MKRDLELATAGTRPSCLVGWLAGGRVEQVERQDKGTHANVTSGDKDNICRVTFVSQQQHVSLANSSALLSPSLLLTPPHYSLLFLTPSHFSSSLLTPPHPPQSSSVFLAPSHSSLPLLISP